MFCHNCGAPLASQSPFCGSCGTPTSAGGIVAGEEGPLRSAIEQVGKTTTTPQIPPRWTRVMLPIAVIGALVLGFLLWAYYVSNSETSFAVHALPKCTDEITLATLKFAVADSPYSKILNLKLLAAKDPVELSLPPEGQVRTCRVTAFTNVGEEPLDFTVKWIERSAGKYYVQIINSDQAQESRAAQASAQDKIWHVVSIESRVTESNNVYSVYSWKLTIRNDSAMPAVFHGWVEFQDADGFKLADDAVNIERDTQVAPASEGVFTGSRMIENTKIVFRTVAKISKER